MKLHYLYGWLVGKKAAFVNTFPDDSPLRQQADAFWRHLDGGTWYFIIAFVVVALLFAWFYYKPFNETPGRHYRPRYWWIFGLVTVIASFATTLGLAWMIASPKIRGSLSIEIGIAIANMLYSAVMYVIFSVLFCNNVFGSTNAYKTFKL